MGRLTLPDSLGPLMVTTIYRKKGRVLIVELVIGVVSGVVSGSFLRNWSRMKRWLRNLQHQGEADRDLEVMAANGDVAVVAGDRSYTHIGDDNSTHVTVAGERRQGGRQ